MKIFDNLKKKGCLTCEEVGPREIEIDRPAEEAEWDGQDGAGHNAPVLSIIVNRIKPVINNIYAV